MKETKSTTPVKYKGLQEADIPLLQKQFGKNIFQVRKRGVLPVFLTGIIKEPMFLLLLVACLLYFLLGNVTEGLMMLGAMMLIVAISMYQEMKSNRALAALRQYTAPKATVIRDEKEKQIATEELVPGDVVLLSEGDQIPADGSVLSANDLTINESIMTGEALPVIKDADAVIFQGTTIDTGKCIIKVTAIGNQTALGKLGKAIGQPETSETLLQQQINRAVGKLALFGGLGFVIICVMNLVKTHDVAGSILLGLTLAMAAIPEEIPVAFSSFMALGAYYMSKRGIISRKPQVIENLGAMSVLCLDKTGTITENSMKVMMIYDHLSGQLTDLEKQPLPAQCQILHFASLASEHQPFDSMEKAILQAYEEQTPLHPIIPEMVHEYPLEGRPPMMTHVYAEPNEFIIAGKGAPERIIKICGLDPVTTQKMLAQIKSMTAGGYRVLGIAAAVLNKNEPFPQKQDQFNWQFQGFLSLYDPPKADAGIAIKEIYDAGITIKLITGDHLETAMHIAAKTGIRNYHNSITGDEIMPLNDAALQNIVNRIVVYARMFPEAKLRVINALKANGEITGMTGDGVNDGPALKAAHIGIAMGKRGTEIARLAADLVIIDDNLRKITEAIHQGRKIYSNLKKAVRYIISIHIPIILTAILPMLSGWKYPVIFTPIHIIFLELIMGPTCSIFFEREPVEATNTDAREQRNAGSLFRLNELLITLLQGLMITAGTLGLYYYFMQQSSLEMTRTMVFNTLLFSNILLTFTNRSFSETIVRTFRYKNNLAPYVVFISLVFLALINLVPQVKRLFGLGSLSIAEFMLCLGVGFVSIAWFELYKALLRKKKIVPSGEDIWLPKN
ncbi:HAD-IC family P-type ATPase [Chitinophaga sp. SYP-B3965]|uniref:cation-translocating P-type ATPase n=1 Tax=Chitinophaga sp. SYP-B3965 TaxID=2663120 RepID=UPI001299BB86|nr:cation-translocating P-type ATPase [Chitinophaga sp. SYP-B3965]MRG45327.1 HAD-IC family P-type ATPase [Chitinophaga sp. SYP-B3965]